MMSSASDPEQDICPICKKEFEYEDHLVTSKLFQKGAYSINESSRKRGRHDVVARAGQKVHKKCRKDWTSEKDIKRTSKRDSDSPSPIKKKSPRISLGPYNSKKDCLFCSQEVIRNNHGHDDIASQVQTNSFCETILAHCHKRLDDWAFIVKGRIEYFAKDLYAPECIYHQQCSSNFRNGRDIPEQFRTEPQAKRKKTGRPKNEKQQQAFLRVCDYLETNDEEHLTVSDLVRQMANYLHEEDSASYSNYYLKEKLKEHYGDSIYIAEGDGHHDIVTLSETTPKILRTYFKNFKNSDQESQKLAIIEAAGKLLKRDIMTNVPSVTDQYPPSQSLTLDAALDYLPLSLRTLLNYLFVGTDKHEKVAAIGQSIIQAVRPRTVVAPLQIGLAAQLHHLYKSKFLVDTLSVMGFGSSYGEVQRFEKNAASVVAADILGDQMFDIVLFAADNVDHNILTLDGKGTFHGMGIIAATTPGQQNNRVVPRRNSSLLNVKDMARIEISDYRFSTFARRHVRFEVLPSLHYSAHTSMVDILWEVSFCFHQQTPNWQGMMHIVHDGCKHPGKSSVTFLPMIDMYPGDPTCILSTLNYICDLAERHKISPIVTFDQPLFWKASEIIYNASEDSLLKKVILMLGSFHTLMNLLGSIGTLMQGTGLTDILGVIFGKNAVQHIMSGKSVQRALRGHLLVEKCLNGMIVCDIIDGYSEAATLVNAHEELYTSLLAGQIASENLAKSDSTIKLGELLQKRKLEIAEQSQTSKLWVSYMHMVKTARMLVMGDRMGSWNIHLCAAAECLPIFAAAGHFKYLKSAYLYLQNMKELETKNPAIYRKFEAGFHVIRRTDNFWAGLGSDLVIEQTLMRSLKSTGGLTRGSGMTEEQRALWTMSSPVSSEYNIALQDFNNHSFTTNEQHKEGTEARMKRDQSDLEKLKEKLNSCSPFSADPTLRNIVTGIVAEDGVNVDDFQTVGRQIIEKMIGQPVFTYTCKRKDKAKTLGDASALSISADRTIDSALLFQRLLVVCRAGEFSLEEVLDYELSLFPPALFEANSIIRQPEKPQLAKAINEYAGSLSDEAVTDTIPQTDSYVLDGGSLMHRVQWAKGNTYDSIADAYVSFTLRNYGKATVVFDGYLEKPSIKDNAHQRRQQKPYPKVSFTSETIFIGKKEEFLSSGSNKQGLINMISDKLRENGCKVINSEGDADYDIVQEAIASSEFKTTTLIGEDTDLLILLLYHMDPISKALYFRSDKSKDQIHVYNVNTLKCLLGDQLCSHLLFIHAFTGCDTTSRIFGVGKKAFFNKFVKGDTDLESCAHAFTTPGQTNNVIEQYGNRTMAMIYGGKPTDTLKSLRHCILKKKVVSATSFVTPERLPPTSSATKFHSFRVYYQIMTWLRYENKIEATDWGWKVDKNQFKPIMSAKKHAPDNLLKVVHCNCTAGCRTERCTCRRYGLSCTDACAKCQTEESCENPFSRSQVYEDDDNDKDDV